MKNFNKFTMSYAEMKELLKAEPEESRMGLADWICFSISENCCPRGMARIDIYDVNDALKEIREEETA